MSQDQINRLYEMGFDELADYYQDLENQKKFSVEYRPWTGVVKG